MRTTSGDVRLQGPGRAREHGAGRAPAAATVPPSAGRPAGAGRPEAPVAPGPGPPQAPGSPGGPDRARSRSPLGAATGASDPKPIGDEDTQPWNAPEPAIDRREAARLDVLRALERGDLDVETASRRLEALDEAGPSSFQGVVLMAADDPLEQVLRLVAEGRVTAEEAASILAALDEQPARRSASVGRRPRAARTPPSSDPGSPTAGAASLRLEVREHGRQVVNLRLPIAVGRLALDRVPGLSGEQVDRVREALNGGLRGPVLEVEDGDNVVRIVLE